MMDGLYCRKEVATSLGSKLGESLQEIAGNQQRKRPLTGNLDTLSPLLAPLSSGK